MLTLLALDIIGLIPGVPGVHGAVEDRGLRDTLDCFFNNDGCVSQFGSIGAFGGGGGGGEQYSVRLSCFTGLVKLIKSLEQLAAVAVEFLLHGIGGGGANIIVFF